MHKGEVMMPRVIADIAESTLQCTTRGLRTTILVSAFRCGCARAAISRRIIIMEGSTGQLFILLLAARQETELNRCPDN